MPPIEVIANCELCMTKYGVNRLIGSKDIAKTNIYVMLTYFLNIDQKGFKGLILYYFGENLE